MFPRILPSKFAWHNASNAGGRVMSSRLSAPRMAPQTANRYFSADIQSDQQQDQPKYTRFDKSVSAGDFLQTLRSHKIGQAVLKYGQLKELKKISTLSYSDMHDYIVMLCKHRPSADFAVPQVQLAQMVESVLSDISEVKYSLHPHLYPVLLRFFVTVGQYERAVSLFEEMLQRDIPQAAESYVSMMVCYQKLGDLDKAEEVFKKAKEQFQHLKYGRYLAERTIIRVYGIKGNLADARQLRDELLARPDIEHDLSTKKMIKLAFLDSCAESKNTNAFMLALDEYTKSEAALDNESYNHILINLSKIGLYDEVVRYLNKHNSQFTPFPGEFRPKTSQHVEEYFDIVLQLREKPLAPSTFSDILFTIVKETQSVSPKTLKLVDIAEQVFTIYEEQILDSFDKLKAIASDMKSKSQLRILQTPWIPGKTQEVSYARMYSVFMRTSNPFIAMAKVYNNVGRREDAISVLQRGYEYQPIDIRQLKHVFGAENVEADPTLMQLCQKN